MSYNILLGRPSLNTLGVVVSTYHSTMKFPSTSGDIITIHVEQPTTTECYSSILRIKLRSPSPRMMHNMEKIEVEDMVDLDPRMNGEV